MTNSKLYYIHDPMCSWCWAFRPALDTLLGKLPESIHVQRVLGGLAPDNEQPMAETMQQRLIQVWRYIEAYVPGTAFNFDFWRINQPRRSTWPACRAVIAARRQRPELEQPMIHAIQQGYYLQAKNPSDTQTLIRLAEDIGCDPDAFANELHSKTLHELLERERRLASQLGVQGFPSLVLATASEPLRMITIDYHAPDKMLAAITGN